jgi:hydroxyacylglutathione hydrolase
MLEIVQIPVLQDNYVYLLHEPGSRATAAVDPALAEPVLTVLRQRGWELSHILNTHHHGDHVGGNLELKHQTGCTVVGMASDRGRIPGIDMAVREGDTVELGGARAQVLEVPGHTRGHGAYWFVEEAALFCGDTLFALGCGRLFEGDPQEMWRSLLKIRSLPAHTRVYCAHEYTQANARFALTVEPGNSLLVERSQRISISRANGLPTVPSALAEECDTNPFLRPQSGEIRRALGLEDAEDWQVFAAIRRLKDQFRG